MNTDDFHPFKNAAILSDDGLTAAMEDYLEMIFRLCNGKGVSPHVVRISQLSQELHIRPSSASKMVNILRDKGLVCFERYGYVSITDTGCRLGRYLMERHEILNRFFSRLNNTNSELAQVELIEHFIDRRTIENMKKILDGGADF